LERDWPGAANSLREGLDEMLTINRLGLPSELRRCLGTTNPIDNGHSALRECGANLPDGGSCRDHLHALLLLEGEIPGVAGSILHFYAVAAYGLQHPDSMNYTTEALAGQHAALDGQPMDKLRRRTRHDAEGAGRITRRAGDSEVSWRRGAWPMTIADVCTAETFGSYETYDEYAGHVTAWARSVRATLDADRTG
jgi:hypothetical protein